VKNDFRLTFRAESLKSEENRVSGLPEEQKTMKNEKYSSSSADEMQKMTKTTHRRLTTDEKCKIKPVVGRRNAKNDENYSSSADDGIFS